VGEALATLPPSLAKLRTPVGASPPVLIRADMLTGDPYGVVVGFTVITERGLAVIAVRPIELEAAVLVPSPPYAAVTV
jgi:hypothetical protein